MEGLEKENLKLKKGALDDLHLPISINSGTFRFSTAHGLKLGTNRKHICLYRLRTKRSTLRILGQAAARDSMEEFEVLL